MAQRDLHFYSTLCIAKAAGYSDEDAVLLAWADEETDYTLQVKPWNCLWSNLGLYFHFVPSNSKDLICQPNSELSKRIIEAASWFGTKHLSLANNIITLGIALHSAVQDPYFHDGWVGKFSRHNVLPAWSHNKFTPSLPFPYGHSPMGTIPDVANAVYLDPRTGNTIRNTDRIFGAITKTGQVLGIRSLPEIYRIFADVEDYDLRKQRLRDLAGMPDLRFSEIRADMLKKYKEPFLQAAAAQAKIVRDYLA